MDICDTGVGISANDQRNLFKVFGKLDSTIHLNKQGVGLGLMISKNIC